MTEIHRRKSSINFMNLKRFHFRSKESRTRINHPPAPEYSTLSEKLRVSAPSSLQCALFCSGPNCKYEQPKHWNPSDMAIQGLYSNWITDDILAMARPNNKTLQSSNIIQQFHSWGIRTVINLQMAGEHAHCGPQLTRSGFTYDPSLLMENEIYFYNFQWKDYEEARLSSLVNMIKVIKFSIDQGRVAIHCHAGLGRTGVLIACYLVFSLRIRANDAIRIVRKARPHSIPTEGQIQCVQQFEHYILPQTIVFSSKEDSIHLTRDKKSCEFTLKQHLHRQTSTLHGIEEKALMLLPKIIYKLCERLLSLCNCSSSQGLDFRIRKIPFTRTFIVHRLAGEEPTEKDPVQTTAVEWSNQISDNSSEDSLGKEIVLTADEIHKAFLLDFRYTEDGMRKQYNELRNAINESDTAFELIEQQEDPNMLCYLLLQWLEGLKKPVLNKYELTVIVIYGHSLTSCLRRLELEDLILIEYLLSFVVRLKPLNIVKKVDIMRRLLAALTHQSIKIGETVVCADVIFKDILCKMLG